MGNLVFRDSARNFNPLCAMSGRVTIAEVEELVDPGQLGPNDIHLPGVYVQRVVPLTAEEAADKRIERRTVRPRPGAADPAAPEEAGAGVTGAAGGAT
jgi:3-oxoacid CoA-transferase subunit A